MRDWNRDRFRWLQEITASDGLSPTAKSLAVVFATVFADAETGECYPSKATLAAAIGRRAENATRMVGIAIRQLETAGWLTVSRGRGRGRASTYGLAFPAAFEPEKRGNVVPLSDARTRRKRGNPDPKKGETQFTPILEPRIDPKARARGGDASQARSRRKGPQPRPRGPAIPEEFVTCPKRIAAWGQWLARNGWPSLEAMGLTALRGGEAGASVPFGWPPSARQAEDQRTAEAFVALKAGEPDDQGEPRQRGFG